MNNFFHVLADTSVLIDYMRRLQKDQTLMHTLFERSMPVVAAVTEFEFCIGRNAQNTRLMSSMMAKIPVIPMDTTIAKIAIDVHRTLKQKNALIGTNDIFIAATALRFEIPIATLNRKHFSRLEADFGVHLLSE
jgi:tRNA(fMet)-specific endonuclease VapC